MSIVSNDKEIEKITSYLNTYTSLLKDIVSEKSIINYINEKHTNDSVFHFKKSGLAFFWKDFDFVNIEVSQGLYRSSILSQGNTPVHIILRTEKEKYHLFINKDENFIIKNKNLVFFFKEGKGNDQKINHAKVYRVLQKTFNIIKHDFYF